MFNGATKLVAIPTSNLHSWRRGQFRLEVTRSIFLVDTWQMTEPHRSCNAIVTAPTLLPMFVLGCTKDSRSEKESLLAGK